MKFRLNREHLESLSSSERKVAEARLAALAEAHSKNPLHRFYPHDRQHLYMASRAPTKLFLGGNRSGKSVGGFVDDIIQAVPRELVPAHLQQYKLWDPPFRCRVIVPDFTQTLSGVFIEVIKRWMPHAAYEGGSFREAWDARDHVLYLAEGSFIQVMTHEQDVSRFQGASLHRVHMDEEMPERLWRENQLRLLDTDGQACFTMTPLSGLSWTYEMFYEPWTKAQPEGWGEDSGEEEITVQTPSGEVTVVCVDLDENPHLPQRAKDRIINDPTMSEEERQARKKGRFISFAGLVYGNSFKKDFNVIPDVGATPPYDDCAETGIPEGADVYVGIDPGIRHMAAVVWCYLDWRNELVAFDEVAIKDQTIPEVCKQIHLKNAQWRTIPAWYVIDPASRNRSGQTGRSDQMEYADNGIFAIPGQNSVQPGIQRVKALMENVWRPDAAAMQKVAVDEGFSDVLHPPKLFITTRCDKLLEQLKRYRWAAPGRSENEPKEMPVKKDDHLLDALRYVVMARPSPPEREIAQDVGDRMARMIREDLEAMESPTVNHPMGPGIFA